ncbi:hypothetical protein R1sor_009205 [Riccia sorocarpa]|uniref:Uncharacterized protein n=1 Tax=Riccia sorocarpa TaxID=122646 RepID=A0ABD3H700_9MARC
MKGVLCRETKRGRVLDRYTVDRTGGRQSSEGSSRVPPGHLDSGLPSRSLPVSSSIGQTPCSNEVLRVQIPAYGAFQKGGCSYQEAADMQQTPECVGGTADSAITSLMSNPSKKPEADLNLRSEPVPELHVAGHKLPAASLKHTLSWSNNSEMQFNIQQEMHIMRQTILNQEALFREQVRELHRVHKVQMLLMEEMRKKGADSLSSSRPVRGGSSEFPADFTSISPGIKRNVRGFLFGQFLEHPHFNLQASIALEGSLKGGLEFTQSESDVVTLRPEIKLFCDSRLTERVLPARRRFDLERSPEDDDDEQEKEQEERVRPMQEIKFTGLPTTCIEPQSDVTLNVGTIGDRREVGTVGRDFLSSPVFHKQVQENGTLLQSGRQADEMLLLPLFGAKSKSQSPLSPTPKMANQGFVGLSHLRLGRKEETSLAVDIDAARKEVNSLTKPKKVSLNLEVGEKVMPLTSQAHPGWLFQDKLVNKAPSTAEAPVLNTNSQESFPLPGNCGQEMLKFKTSFCTDARGNMVCNESSISGGEMQEQADEGVQPLIGVYTTPFLGVGGINPASPGFTLYDMRESVGISSREVLTLQSSWRDGGEPKDDCSHSVFASRQTGGFPALGMQLRTFEEHAGFSSHSVVVGSAVNKGSGAGAFFANSGSGVWYGQRTAYSQFQQFQQQPASMHARGALDITEQKPVHVTQGGRSPQRAVYSIAAADCSSTGLPFDELMKIREGLPGLHRPVGTRGEAFTGQSVDIPPTRSFKKPPKLVLPANITTLELKLVSPGKGLRNLQDVCMSGSSEDELRYSGRMIERKDIDAGLVNLKDPDDDNAGFPSRVALGYHTDGKSEEDEQPPSPSLNMKSASFEGGSWIEKAAQDRVLTRRHSSWSEADNSNLNEEPGKAANDGDDGDVRNPGNWASPLLVTTHAAGNPPRSEEQERLRKGEIGTDVESRLLERGRLKNGKGQIMDRISFDEKILKHQELPHGQLTMSLVESNSSAGRCSDVTVKRMKLSHSSSEEVGYISEHRWRCFNNLPENGSCRNPLSPEFEGVGEFTTVQQEPQPSGASGPELKTNSSKLQEVDNHAVERTKSKDGSDCRTADRDFKFTVDASKHFTEHSIKSALNSVQERNSDHSKQLSGASTASPAGREEGGEHQNNQSPGLHQISSLPVEEAEGHAEGSSTVVSQALETVQLNDTGHLRTGSGRQRVEEQAPLGQSGVVHIDVKKGTQSSTLYEAA